MFAFKLIYWVQYALTPHGIRTPYHNHISDSSISLNRPGSNLSREGIDWISLRIWKNISNSVGSFVLMSFLRTVFHKLLAIFNCVQLTQVSVFRNIMILCFAW